MISLFPNADYGKIFTDLPSTDNFTTLSLGYLWWLISIRHGHLVLCIGNVYYIEPYYPSRFSRQFIYDQLYVENPNTSINSVGNLFEGVRAWYYFVSGGMKARFSLPLKTPNLHISFGFCSWYSVTRSAPLNFNMNSTYLRDIKVWFSQKKEISNTRVPRLDEFWS